MKLDEKFKFITDSLYTHDKISRDESLRLKILYELSKVFVSLITPKTMTPKIFEDVQKETGIEEKWLVVLLSILVDKKFIVVKNVELNTFYVPTLNEVDTQIMGELHETFQSKQVLNTGSIILDMFLAPYYPNVKFIKSPDCILNIGFLNLESDPLGRKCFIRKENRVFGSEEQVFGSEFKIFHPANPEIICEVFFTEVNNVMKICEHYDLYYAARILKLIEVRGGSHNYLGKKIASQKVEAIEMLKNSSPFSLKIRGDIDKIRKGSTIDSLIEETLWSDF